MVVPGAGVFASTSFLLKIKFICLFPVQIWHIMALYSLIPAFCFMGQKWGKNVVYGAKMGQILYAVLSSPDRESNHHPCKSEDNGIYHLSSLFSSAISKKIKE